jgi:hypothetical protein
MLAVAAAVPLALRLLETEALPLGVLAALEEGVALFDSEAPTVREAVADAVDDPVLLGVAERLPVPLALRVLDTDALGVHEEETLLLRVTDADGEFDGVLEGVGLFDGVTEGVGVSEGAAPPVR